MKALFISNNPSLFDTESVTYTRPQTYAAAIGTLHILLYSAEGHIDRQDGAFFVHGVAARSLSVDDSSGELALMETPHPQMKLYEMHRDGKEGDSRWPVVRSLAELP